MAVSSWLTLKPSSLRSVMGPMVSALMVMLTTPAGTAALVVTMMKSCLPRFVVNGALGSLNAKEAAGAKHHPPEPHNLSEDTPWLTCWREKC